MTRRSRKAASQLRGLNWLLAVGSVMAALVGTRLLASNDLAHTAVSPQTAGEAQIIVIPASPYGQDGAGGSQLTTRQIELAPVPTAAAPDFRPVTRSRSSR